MGLQLIPIAKFMNSAAVWCSLAEVHRNLFIYSPTDGHVSRCFHFALFLRIVKILQWTFLSIISPSPQKARFCRVKHSYQQRSQEGRGCGASQPSGKAGTGVNAALKLGQPLLAAASSGYPSELCECYHSLCVSWWEGDWETLPQEMDPQVDALCCEIGTRFHPFTSCESPLSILCSFFH